jgi:hypothetical protein
VNKEKGNERATQSMNHQPQALFIPEILEAILLELPLQDLLTNAQLVNREWRTAIKSSKSIQKALFFKADPAASSQKPRFNPLLQKAFPPWFDGRRHYRGKPFTDLKWSKNDEKRTAYMRKEASWRRMLPMQPPPHVLKIDKASYYMRGNRRWKGQKRFWDGVRMASLYDYALVSAMAPVSSFEVDWHLRKEVDGDGDDALGERAAIGHEVRKDFVTMNVSWTAQCCMGMRADVGVEFKSEGFKQKDIRFKMREQEAPQY